LKQNKEKIDEYGKQYSKEKKIIHTKLSGCKSNIKRPGKEKNQSVIIKELFMAVKLL
jgi:hypothetical protein